MIKWLDGKHADGMFVIEITFQSGYTGYMKQKTYADAEKNCNFFWCIHDGITSMKIHDPSGKIVKSLHENMSVAC